MTAPSVTAELRRLTALYQLRSLALHMGVDPASVELLPDGPRLTVAIDALKHTSEQGGERKGDRFNHPGGTSDDAA